MISGPDRWCSCRKTTRKLSFGGNLQCYAGGEPNDPKTWAGYIQTALPGFNIDRYILASDWTRFWDTNQQLLERRLSGHHAVLACQVQRRWRFLHRWRVYLDDGPDFHFCEQQQPGSDCDSSGGSQTAYLNAMLGLKPS